MGLPCIKEPSGTPYACGTVGNHHIYPPTVSVASILPSNMHFTAQGADFLLFRHNDIRNITQHWNRAEPTACNWGAV